METAKLESVKTCDICQQSVDTELWYTHRQAEELILKKIVEQYPNWANNDGSPSEKCKTHYREFIIKKRA